MLFSPCTKTTFFGYKYWIKFRIPLKLLKIPKPFASACALKDIFLISIFTLYSFLSRVIFYTPDSNLFPKVPATQYPGIIKVFFSFSHHSLNTFIESPPCNIPYNLKSNYYWRRQKHHRHIAFRQLSFKRQNMLEIKSAFF